MSKVYDVIIIGGGHAGLEAAFICAKLGKKVGLIALDKKTIGFMPCNPSIGGPAKGVVTREIDALGGMQAKVTDKSLIQIKMLNSSKGAGVWALRAQVDKIKYSEIFLEEIEKNKNIDLILDEATSLHVENKKIAGIYLVKEYIKTKVVIIATGTFLDSLIHIGKDTLKSGPANFNRSTKLADSIKTLGVKTLRLKTGTPPRILKNTINYEKMQIESGDNKNLSFSHFTKNFIKYYDQVPCYLTYTNEKTHKIIKNNLRLSGMYNGQISGIGPRYCPSIEDKISRFSDKPRHQIFVEPESKTLNTMYIQGLSTSFPKELQQKIVNSIDGLEDAKIESYAYAIEYEAIDPTQLKLSYEYKYIDGLFFAGQINGTSGYEEAAAQGLMAGINASNYIDDKEMLILKRHESYIGVMTDDIVTKGILEPYRLLTSRAEHRLFLRNDNAIERLIKHSIKYNLLDKDEIDKYKQELKIKNDILVFLETEEIRKYELLKKYNKPNLKMIDLLKNPEINFNLISSIINKFTDIPESIKEQIEISIKFSGYIKKQEKIINELKKEREINLSSINDYNEIKNLSLEAIEKLNKIRPLTLHQAERISGINLIEIGIIKIYLKNKEKNE